MSLLAVATTPGVGATAGYAGLARVERNGHPESWHFGAAAVVTPAGSLIGRLGDPTLHSNCSGKHAGMLLYCRLHGWPTESYLELDHPLQQRVLEHGEALPSGELP